jgi:hypothetical protein
MTDLRSQIGTYLEETSIPVDVEALVTSQELRPGVAVTPRRVRRRWHPAVVFVVAAVAVLLIGVPLFLFGVSSSAPVAEVPTVTTTVPPATTVTTIPVPPSSPLPAAPDPGPVLVDPIAVLSQGWEQVSLDEFYDLRFAEPPDVAVSDAGFVAVVSGGIGFDGGMPYGESVALYSSDGFSWERSEFLDTGMNLRGVVAGGPGFVAVGSWCDPTGDVCMANPAVWTSSDGVEWARVASDETVFPGCSSLDTIAVSQDNESLMGLMRGGCGNDRPAEIENVNATQHGLVAVGLDPGGVVQWHSTDGIDWTRVPFSARPAYPDPGPGVGWWFNSQDKVGVWTSIGLFQPGTRCVDRFDGDDYLGQDCWGTVFTSTDGERWVHEANGDETFPETWIYSTLEVPDGVVVIGTRGCIWGCPSADPDAPGGAVVWFTEDGQHWLPGSFEDAEDVSQILDVVATEFGYVALGIDHDTKAFLWHSEDGRAWVRVPADPDVFGTSVPRHLAAHGSQLVMSAYEEGALPEAMPRVWIWLWNPPA